MALSEVAFLVDHAAACAEGGCLHFVGDAFLAYLGVAEGVVGLEFFLEEDHLWVLAACLEVHHDEVDPCLVRQDAGQVRLGIEALVAFLGQGPFLEVRHEAVVVLLVQGGQHHALVLAQVPWVSLVPFFVDHPSYWALVIHPCVVARAWEDQAVMVLDLD